jgi:hypothetical protein
MGNEHDIAGIRQQDGQRAIVWAPLRGKNALQGFWAVERGGKAIDRVRGKSD